MVGSATATAAAASPALSRPRCRRVARGQLALPPGEVVFLTAAPGRGRCRPAHCRTGRCAPTGRRSTTSSSSARSRDGVLGEDAEHLLLADRLLAVEAGIQVGDQGDRGVAKGQLAGEDGFWVTGHVDQRPALCGEPLRLGLGREPRSLDDHRRPAVGRLPAGRRGPLQHDAPTGGAVGLVEATCTAPVSWNVCARPLVRSTSWSGTTSEPGPSSGRRLPTAHGASTWRTPQARSAQRLAR